MAIFLKAQLGGYPEVLNHKVLTRIQTPQITTTNALSACEGSNQLIKNTRYALGWRVVDFDHHKLVFHGGWVKGFTNFIAFMPEEQIGIVVLHNGESKFSSKTAVKFFELYLDVPKSMQSKKSEKLFKTSKFAKQFSNSKHTHKKVPTKKLKLKTVSRSIHPKRVSKSPARSS